MSEHGHTSPLVVKSATPRKTRIRDLLNIYGEESCRVWFALDRHTLELEEATSLGWPMEVGTYPEWLEYELGCVGWADILDLPHREEERVKWALEQGIAPGQPFLMEVDRPHYSQSQTECGTEYDTEYSAELVLVAPLPADIIARRWEVWLWWNRKARAASERAEAKRQEKEAEQHARACADPSALYLVAEPYYGPGGDMDYGPGAIRIFLRSAHMPHHWGLAHGEDDRGNQDAAMRRLLEVAAKTLPNVRPEFIRALPWHRPLIVREEAVRG